MDKDQLRECGLPTLQRTSRIADAVQVARAQVALVQAVREYTERVRLAARRDRERCWAAVEEAFVALEESQT